MKRFMTAVLLVLIAPAMCLAQPLSDRVPENALIYIAWRGSESPGADYEQSHLHALVEASNLDQITEEVIPGLMQRLAMEDRRAAAELQRVLSIAGPLLRRPTAFFFAGVDWENPQMPTPRAGLLCSAGTEADALLQRFEALAAEAREAPFPIKAFKAGEIVALTVGYERPDLAIAGGAGGAARPLAGNERFKSAMAQVLPDPVIAVYVDNEAVLALVDRAVQFAGDQEAMVMWPKVRDALGITGLKRSIWTGGFDGRDWSTRAFLAAPAPRSGLLRLMDQPPASEQMLKLIPPTATWFALGQFDFSRLLAELREAAGKVDPDAQKAFDQGMGAVKMATMVNLQTDLFEALGPEWAMFVDPEAVGRGVLGVTLVNRLRKPADAERAMKRLELFLDNVINAQLRREKIRVTFAQTKAGDLTIRYVALPGIAPCWTIKEGNLYVALYPQVIIGAAESSARGQSILDNPGFAALRQRLGAEQASGYYFVDLPRTVPDAYQILLALSQLAMGAADMMGAQTPAMIVPPLSKLREHLAPAAGISWTDDAGWHSRSLSPFPGSTLFSIQGAIAAIGGIGIGAGIPVAVEAPEQAQRTQAMNHLRQIGIALHMYVDANEGRFPPDLGTLLARGLIGRPEVFMSPASGKAVPAEIRQAEPEQLAGWVNQNSDFVYVGADRKLPEIANVSRFIVAYEEPSLRPDRMTVVLFADGHIELLPVDRVKQMIEQ